jgi:hypothetical protein
MSKPHSMGGECGGQLESTLRMVDGSLKRWSIMETHCRRCSSLGLVKGEASENVCTEFSKLITCSHPNAFSNDEDPRTLR